MLVVVVAEFVAVEAVEFVVVEAVVIAVVEAVVIAVVELEHGVAVIAVGGSVVEELVKIAVCLLQFWAVYKEEENRRSRTH